MRACSLRLTNVYGPRQLIKHNRQGFIGWFIRLAIEGREIQIYGDGSQLRDFVYVDDAADAFLRAGASDACNGEVFNVGGDEPISHRDLVDAARRDRRHRVGARTSTWPPEKKAIDIGSFYADSTKFRDDGRLAAAGRLCARACGARSRSTASTSTTTSTLPRASRGERPVIPFLTLALRRGRGRRAGGDRARDRARLVRARPGGRGVRARVRGRVRRAARASASAPAPTRIAIALARARASARATRSSRRRSRRRTRRSRS